MPGLVWIRYTPRSVHIAALPLTDNLRSTKFWRKRNEKGFPGYLPVQYGHSGGGAARPATGFRAELCRFGGFNGNEYRPDDYHRRFGCESGQFLYWIPSALHGRPRSSERDDLHRGGLSCWRGPECGTGRVR